MLTLWTMPNFKGTKKEAALVLFICLCLDAFVFMCCLSSCNDKENKIPCPNYYNCENFKVGDTLYPDYPHEDTLIVTSIASADTLNQLFSEPLPKVATDSEIDSVLHKYCRTYYHTCKWKLCPYKGIDQSQFAKSVAAYTGLKEGDAYSIDMLHLYYPQAEYEELETMLKED